MTPRDALLINSIQLSRARMDKEKNMEMATRLEEEGDFTLAEHYWTVVGSLTKLISKLENRSGRL